MSFVSAGWGSLPAADVEDAAQHEGDCRDFPDLSTNQPDSLEPGIRDKVRVIPLGIDEASYPAEGDDGVFGRIGLDGGEPYFLFIGVLRYYKGLHTLIEAARHVNARIVIAGSGPEGERIRALSSQLGTRNVLFAGQISDPEKVALLKGCRALVLPSHLRSEAYGMVLVEASIFGRPRFPAKSAPAHHL